MVNQFRYNLVPSELSRVLVTLPTSPRVPRVNGWSSLHWVIRFTWPSKKLTSLRSLMEAARGLYIYLKRKDLRERNFCRRNFCEFNPFRLNSTKVAVFSLIVSFWAFLWQGISQFAKISSLVKLKFTFIAGSHLSLFPLFFLFWLFVLLIHSI